MGEHGEMMKIAYYVNEFMVKISCKQVHMVIFMDLKLGLSAK
jgi:hypothetical protein